MVKHRRIERVAPVFASPRVGVAVPVTVRRGARSPIAEQIATLDIGQSIGILNKTKIQIASVVSKENNRQSNVVLSADGTKTRIKEFVVHDVDPATDVDHAKVRIFRVK